MDRGPEHCRSCPSRGSPDPPGRCWGCRTGLGIGQESEGSDTDGSGEERAGDLNGRSIFNS